MSAQGAAPAPAGRQKGPGGLSLNPRNISGERVALLAFLGEALLAGGNAVAVRFSNRELEPLWGAGLRFALAAAIFMGAVAVMRLNPPHGRALLGAVLYGLLGFGGSFALAYYALLRVHAGVSQTILALVPLATLMLAVLEGQERLRPAAVAGTLLGLAGIAIMSGASLGNDVPLLSLLAILGSVLCFSQAAVLVRRFPRLHPVTMNAVAMSAGAAVLLAGSVLAGEQHQIPKEPSLGMIAGIVVAAGTILLDILVPALKLPDWVHQFALTAHYGEPMLGSWNPVGIAVSLALAVGGLALGAWGFSRRDLRT